MNFNHMSNLEVFEKLNDRVSEKISGGNGGCVIDPQDTQLATDLLITIITDDPCLQKKIVEQAKKILPNGVGDAISLSCAQGLTELTCNVASNNINESFTIPLK